MAERPGRAVVLVSGGLDSATALAFARRDGFELFALTFDYGQRHRSELDAARAVCRAAGVRQHRVFALDLRQFGGSALTDAIDVPKGRSDAAIAEGIPPTYVPARNTVFLSLAIAWGETLGAFDVFVGVNAIDYSGYPDCRPEFIAAFERVANLGTKAGVEGAARWTIRTPLIGMTKAAIIEAGAALGVDFALTQSCYDPGPEGRPCGRCDACVLRRKGFAEAGRPDPLEDPAGQRSK